MISAADGTLALRLYRPPNSEQSAVVLYLHGGEMITCDLNTRDGGCEAFARELNKTHPGAVGAYAKGSRRPDRAATGPATHPGQDVP